MAPSKIFAEPEISDALRGLALPSSLSMGFIIGTSADNRHRIVHIAPIAQLTKDDEDEARRNLVTVEECSVGNPDGTEDSSHRRSPSSDKLADADLKPGYSGPKSLLDVKANLVTEQAAQLARLLPGKFRILGLAIISPVNILDAGGKDLSKISAMMDAVNKRIASDSKAWLLDETLDMDEWLLAAADSKTKRFKYAMGTLPFVDNQRPCEWKFLTEATKWHEFAARVAVDLKFFVPQEMRDDSLFKQLKVCLKPFAVALKDAQCLVDGCMRDPSEVIEPQKESAKKKSRLAKEPVTSQHIRCHRVELVLEPRNGGSIKYWKNTVGFFHLRGSVACRAYADGKTSIGRVLSELKVDLLRSLFVRLRMHCDSLLEEDDLTSVNFEPVKGIGPTDSASGAVVLHELPRRVLVTLTPFDDDVESSSGSTRASPRRGPEYVSPKILVCDYLFPGEGEADACQSLSNILGIPIPEDRVMDCSETVAFERRTSGLLSEAEGTPGPVENDLGPEVSIIKDDTQMMEPDDTKMGSGNGSAVSFKFATVIGLLSVLFALIMVIYSKLFR